MKKMHFVTVFAVLICAIVGCSADDTGTHKERKNDVNQSQKNDEIEQDKEYVLVEVENFDKTFEEIYAISHDGATGKFLVFADEGVYLHSGDKIYTNETHFDLEREIDFSKAWSMGDRIDIYNMTFLAESEDARFPFEQYVMAHNTSSIVRLCTLNHLRSENNSYWKEQICVNEGNGIRVYEANVDWNDVESSHELKEIYFFAVPNGEIIEKTIMSARGDLWYITNQDHIYYIAVPEDDPSHTYADVEPTYQMVQDELYEILKEDFGLKIQFYNGYLVTDDNKCYEVIDRREPYPTD